MEFGILSAEAEKTTFIKECEVNDIPRLANTVFPEGLEVLSNISYIDDGLDEHKLDLYTPLTSEKGDEALFVIHGGAFVYGYKELDKEYAMYVALKASIPAVNTNYRLLPGTDLKGALSDLCAAVNYACEKYGFKKLHMTGDSAGGYLSTLMTCVINNESVQKDLGVSINPYIKAVSLSPICGCLTGSADCFPMCYFTKEDETLPSYVYNLMDLIEVTGLPRVASVTGDNDFLLEENLTFDEFMTKQGIPHTFYNAISHDDFNAHHVFPICDPKTPEGKFVVEMVAKNARG